MHKPSISRVSIPLPTRGDTLADGIRGAAVVPESSSALLLSGAAFALLLRR